jgi:hypothetical protein
MMQSALAVPFNVSLLEVPIIILVPAGQHDGLSPRTAVTFCTPVVAFPNASTAYHVTTVVPIENFAGASFAIATLPPHESLAWATPIFGVWQPVIVMSGGTVNTGGTVSTTVICTLSLALPSVALETETVAVAVPTGNRAVGFAILLLLNVMPGDDHRYVSPPLLEPVDALASSCAVALRVRQYSRCLRHLALGWKWSSAQARAGSEEAGS